jgi:hypothetical protein
MRSILLGFFLASAVSVAAPVPVQAAPPKTSAPKPAAPTAPATTGCKSVADCTCPKGDAKMCVNGKCGCSEPVVIEAQKVTP